MNIRKYNKELDEDKVMQIIELEGEEWKEYWGEAKADQYKNALEKSITYVADEDGEICGYSRSIDDYACEIIVVDLLVTPKHRGKGLGSKLMEILCKEYSSKEIYVMSDVDEFYKKQGYQKVGSVFQVKAK